jgi:hypothetical protein
LVLNVLLQVQDLELTVKVAVHEQQACRVVWRVEQGHGVMDLERQLPGNEVGDSTRRLRRPEQERDLF